MSVLKLLQFAAEMAAASRNVEEVRPEIVAEACRMIAGKAKDLIGVPNGSWPPLAPATIARKDGVNTPLLETGALRDSIEWNSDRDEGYVGTDDRKAAFQEYGTVHIPPRPFIGGALNMEAAAIERMAARAVAAAFEAGSHSELGELLHLAKEAAAEAAHEAHGWVEGDR